MEKSNKKNQSKFNKFFNKALPYIGIRGIRQHLVKRMCSAFVISMVFLTAIYIHKYLFMFLMLFTLIGMITEWFDLVNRNRDLLLGLFLINISVSIVILARFLCDYRVAMLFFCILWINDTLAMFGGKKLRGPKIAPKVSPSKTYSGFLCGIIGSICFSYLFSETLGTDFHNNSHVSFIPIYLYAGIIAFIAFFSDLLVSYFKRIARVKDTGTIIPGHGGVLDRFDSLILTGPMLLVYFI